MIEIRQTIELPTDIEALTNSVGVVHLRVSGVLGLYALNRAVELLQEAAEELKAAL